MKTRNIFFTFTLFFAGVINFCSCDSVDDFNNDNAEQTLGEKATEAPKAAVLSFDTFDGKKVVEMDKDTTLISIDHEYLTNNDITLEKDMYLDIWLGADQAAFVCQITELLDESNVKVKTACITDILPAGSYNLDMDPYIAPSQSLRLGNGRINPDAYYRPSDDTYHPIAYVAQQPTLKANNLEQYYELPIARWKSPMVEDLPQANGSLDIKFIDATANTSFVVPLGDGWGQIGMDSLAVRAYAGMTFRLDIGWDYFTPYVETFEAKAQGTLDFTAAASLQFGKSFPLIDDEDPIFNFGHYYATFCVGIFPVTIDCNPQILFTTNLSATGKMQFSTRFNCGIDLQAGVGYYHGDGWKNLSHANGHSEATGVTPTFFGSISTNIGLMLSVPFRLYGLAGPKFSAGPQLRTSYSAAYNADKNQLDCAATMGLWFAGKVGADISLAGHTFAKWETGVDCHVVDFVNKKWSSKTTDSEQAKEYIEEAKANYYGIPEGVNLYNLNTDNIKRKAPSFDGNNHIISLHTDPAYVTEQLNGVNLQVGDYLSIKHDGITDIVRLSDMYEFGPQALQKEHASEWVAGWVMYCFDVVKK